MVSSAQLPQPSPFCRRVGARVFTFEACSAFTHVMARTDRSTAQGGLYHGASVQPVTRSNCPLATGSNHQVSRWVLPPLAFRALVAHYRKKVARPAVDAFVATVAETLAQGGDIGLTGFGSFEVVEQPARIGRNPRTGEEIAIAASKTPKFRPGAVLKAAVAGNGGAD